MAKIRIVVADSDEFYLNRIVNYLIERTNTFDVQSFTIRESFIRYIENNANKIDIVAVSEDMSDRRISESSIPAKILLTDGSYSEVSGFDIINKYQKAENFINGMLMIYAEKTGRMDAVSAGDKETKVIGYFSPVGGSGKTTLALVSAAALARKGKRTFYLNLEKINSSATILDPAPTGTMSDVYLAKKTKGANVGLKIIANKYMSPVSGINYINPSESSLELNELTSTEIHGLIKEFDGLGEFDYVMVDMDSEMNGDNIKILDACDKIVVPFTPEQLSLSKIGSFFREVGIHDELAEIRGKMVAVLNKAMPNAIIPGEITYEASVALTPIFADLRTALNNTELIVPQLEEFVSRL